MAVIDNETYYTINITKPVGGTKMYMGLDFENENAALKRVVTEVVPGVEVANLSFDPVYVTFDYPLWVGKTWTDTTNVTGMIANETGTSIPINTSAVVFGNVTSQVNLTVPYGTIHCLVVEVNVNLQDPPVSFLRRNWMSDGEMPMIPKYQSHDARGNLMEELELIEIVAP